MKKKIVSSISSSTFVIPVKLLSKPEINNGKKKESYEGFKNKQ